MPAYLVALTEGPNILLDKPIMLFGRHPECDIQIDSRKVSRRHCCIAQVSDYLVIRDLGSTNGIRINGVRVLEGKLRAGDEVTIGNHRYQVRWDLLAPSGVRPAPAKAAPKPPPPRVPAPPLDEDELLEECDEPIPLQEPEAAPSRRPVRVPPAESEEEDEDADSAPGHQSAVHGPPLTERPPPVLPDDLNLAPASDVLTPRRQAGGEGQ
jgi:predicted component of type VI protein secretion system